MSNIVLHHSWSRGGALLAVSEIILEAAQPRLPVCGVAPEEVGVYYLCGSSLLDLQAGPASMRKHPDDPKLAEGREPMHKVLSYLHLLLHPLPDLGDRCLTDTLRVHGRVGMLASNTCEYHQPADITRS